MTKFLFKKYGFLTVLSDEKFPLDLSKDRCLGLMVSVRDDSGMFTTKSIIELRDCFNNVVFTSAEGKSKEKDYKKAYHESIRSAFKSIKDLKYRYVPFKDETIDEPVVNRITTKPKIIEIKTVVENTVNKVELPSLSVQSITNGFQLVNTKSAVVFQLLNTNVNDIFILKNKNGIFYKNNGVWMAEYYKDGLKIIEKYEVKF